MSRILLGSIAVLGILGLAVAGARAADVTTKNMLIKDNPTPTKRLVQVQSKDLSILGTDAGDPGTNGATLHLYSATDDYCAVLPPGSEWKLKKGKWTYKGLLTKNTATIKDKLLLMKIKANVGYTLADNGTQGTVNAEVQFGNGTRFCMRCTGNKADTVKKFQGKDCAAAACDPEPSACPPPTTTTTTLPCALGSSVVLGSLPATPGRFNYNLTLGLPGAGAACNTSFAGSHVCSYPELQAAAACNLAGLKDTNSTTVTSFWAIDGSQPALQQCNDDAPVTGSGLNWEYGTAHTLSRGQRVSLDNTTGALGTLQTGVQCNISGTSWVACCQ